MFQPRFLVRSIMAVVLGSSMRARRRRTALVNEFGAVGAIQRRMVQINKFGAQWCRCSTPLMQTSVMPFLCHGGCIAYLPVRTIRRAGDS